MSGKMHLPTRNDDDLQSAIQALWQNATSTSTRRGLEIPHGCGNYGAIGGKGRGGGKFPTIMGGGSDKRLHHPVGVVA